MSWRAAPPRPGKRGQRRRRVEAELVWSRWRRGRGRPAFQAPGCGLRAGQWGHAGRWLGDCVVPGTGSPLACPAGLGRRVGGWWSMALGALLLHAVLASGSPCVSAAGKACCMRPLRSDACALAARLACQPVRSCLGSESRRERGVLEGATWLPCSVVRALCSGALTNSSTPTIGPGSTMPQRRVLAGARVRGSVAVRALSSGRLRAACSRSLVRRGRGLPCVDAARGSLRAARLRSRWSSLGSGVLVCRARRACCRLQPWVAALQTFSVLVEWGALASPLANTAAAARVASARQVRCWRGSRRVARAQDVARGGGGHEPTQPVRLRR